MTFSEVDDRNLSAYQYSLANFEQFSAICQPLVNHLQVKHFSYIKMFPDSSYLHFSTEPSWQKFYYENILHTSIILDGESLIKEPDVEGGLIQTFWPIEPNSQLTQAVYDYGFWGGLIFTKFSADHTERWVFSSNRSESKLIGFYMQNISLLLKFIEYFNYRAHDLIKTDSENRHKLAIFKNGIIYPKAQPNLRLDLSVEQFLNEINIEGAVFNNIFKTGKIFSPRELECFGHIVCGGTTKEIAKNMQISPRTVEVFIKNIKEKTGYCSRSDLVRLYQNNYSFFKP